MPTIDILLCFSLLSSPPKFYFSNNENIKSKMSDIYPRPEQFLKKHEIPKSIYCNYRAPSTVYSKKKTGKDT